MIIGRGICQGKVLGIHRNTLELLNNLDKMVPPGQVEVLVPANEQINLHFQNIAIENIGKEIRLPNPLGNRLTSYLYRNWYFKNYARKNHAVTVDMLLVFPDFGCDVIMIYDCIPERFPQNYVTPRMQKSRRRLLHKQANSVAKCRRILTDSYNARNDILEFYKPQGKPIQVIPCAWQHFERVQEDDAVIDRLGLREKDYFFSMGSRFPHKNIQWVSRAAAQNPQYTFVVSGAIPGDIKDTSYEGSQASNVVFTGYLSDPEVKALMRHCKAFIQPSLYEGFGIPPMEAMSVGADCIVSNAASLPEVYGNSVWYIDPLDYDHIDLDEIMSRPKESNDVILNKFSWEKSARELWETLRKLAEE